jgi:hypothetical protein
MAKKVLNVTLAVTIDTDINEVGDIVDNLTFDVTPDNNDVKVNDSEIVDYFEVF